MQKPDEMMPGKYQLKSLHEDIALCDRKLAHMEKYETYASAEERESAMAKMTTKRAKLAKAAQKLAEDGVEFLPSELPLSLRPVAKSEEHAAQVA
ncbi:MAG TPA: hypothetical protein VII58_09745 [Acidobacteriaceae bacterium]